MLNSSSPLPDPDPVTPGTADDCILAIADGEVYGVSDVGEAAAWLINHKKVTEIIRMPRKAARVFIFQPWPGRDAALALLAQEASQ